MSGSHKEYQGRRKQREVGGGGHFNIRAPFSLKKGIFPLFYLEKRALWEKVEGAHAPNAPGSYAYEEYSDP